MWNRLLRFGFRLLYNELAFTYDAVAWGVSLGKWRAWCQTAMRHLRGQRILELAHGPGHLLVALRRAGYRPIGIDLSAHMGRQAARRIRQAGLDIPIVRCRAQALPFRMESFDSVAATFPTEYIVDPASLREAARVSRHGAPLVIVAAAGLGGRGPLPRLIDALYKVTGQSHPMPDSDHPAFEQTGWTVRADWERVGNSTVFLAIGEKSTAKSAKDAKDG